MIDKLSTLVRGTVRESMAHVVDANAIRIFEQEIHDNEKMLASSKSALVHVSAEVINLKREIEKLQNAIAMREQQAVMALNKSEPDLAETLAKHIVDQEKRLQDLTASLQSLASQEENLTSSIKSSITRIKDCRRELAVVKAVQFRQDIDRKMNKANCSAVSSENTLLDSLSNIKRQQQAVDDQINAAKHIDKNLQKDDLDSVLREKGIVEEKQYESVLSRIRSKSNQY